MASLCSRNQIQKDELLTAEHTICLERAVFYTQSFKETEGEPAPIRVAKALKKTFENMTINISPQELLVGNRSSKLIGPPIASERGDMTTALSIRLPELKKFGYNISKEEKKLLFKEIIPYWKGKTVRDLKVQKFVENELNSTLNFSRKEFSRKMKAFGIRSIFGLLLGAGEGESKLKQFINTLSFLVQLPRHLRALKSGTADNVIGRGRCTDAQAHIVVGYKNIFKLGYNGLMEKALEREKTASSESEKSFLESVVIVARAIKDFSERFSSLASEMAEGETNEQRRDELLKIAEICKKVPWNPPDSFREALQAMWFMQNAIIISYGAGSGITPGRVDQLLYPYYKKDIDAGIITKEEALTLLEEFIIKINNNVIIWPYIVGLKLNHLGSDVENITIGGVDKEGSDATNELSYLFMDAIRNTKLATSSSFRISKKSPRDYVKKVIELYRTTSGVALFNDDIVIKAMENDGYTIEAAREYCIVGCVEPSGNADSFGATGGTKIYLPTILDLVFNRGRISFFGNVDSIDTGDPTEFKSFDEFMDAYYKQLQYVVSKVALASNLRDEIYAEKYPNPLLSCTIDDCIENAKDMTAGGAKYNFVAMGGGGLATVIDSLAAIKKFVYDEKSVSMEELMDALATNFKNKEDLRQKLLNGPKFGNDDDYVDSMGVELVNKFGEMSRNEKTIMGGHYKTCFSSYGLNIYEGILEPATPNGRSSMEAFSNGISPSNNAEVNGPTAAMNSVTKLDHAMIGYGDALNMKFPPSFLQTDEGVEKIADLVQTYFSKGGFHVQFNFIGQDTLKDAQEHPENYSDLIVRVTGYSAYFTRLGKEIQDDIIDRLEFTSC
ncbi:MAG: glycyl radical protein [Candidatus Hodarchaeota archaeon]